MPDKKITELTENTTPATSDFLVEVDGAGNNKKVSILNVLQKVTPAAQAVGFTIAGGTTSKTLTVEDTSLVNQDLTTDADPTFDTLTLTSGQLVFPATQVPSAGANTLDDYEEGTWTPSVGGDATYTTQVGTYIKIGRQVTVTFNLKINVIGTGSTAIISGLPFAAIAGRSPGSLGYWEALAVNVISIYPFVESAGQTIKFVSSAAAGVTCTDATAIFGNGTHVLGSLTYIAG